MVDAIVEYDYTSENDDELTISVGDIITNIIQQKGGWWEGDLNGQHGLFPDNFVRVLREKPKALVLDPDIQAKRNSLEKMLADGVVRRADQGSKKRRRAKVVYSYAPTNEDELKLEVDDVLEVMEQDEEGWYRGLLHGKEGVFPSNFVKLFEEEDDLSNKEKESEEESKMAKPKKVFGVGLGNIFESGPIQLKSTISAAKPVTTNEMTAVVRKGTLPPKKPPPPTPAPSTPKLAVKEYALVLYPYDSENNDELSLKEGELVIIISKDIEDKGWWKGELNGKIGVFPDNFVEAITYEEAKKRKLISDNSENTSSLPQNKSPKSTELPGLDKSSEPSVTDKTQEALKLDKLQEPLKPEKPQEPPKPERFQEPIKSEKPQELFKSDKTQDPLRPERISEPPKPEKSQEPFRPERPPEPSKPEKPPLPELPKIDKTKTAGNTDPNKSSELIKKLPPELPKKDVKTDNKPPEKIERPSAPPIPIKKPQLPPPTKKPVKPPAPASILPTNTFNSTEVHKEQTEENSKDKLNNNKDKPDNSDDFDSIESTEKLTHLTVNRAKNPNRRPPSQQFLKENDKDDDNGEPIWMKELKKNQAKRISQNIPDSKSKDVTPEEVPATKNQPLLPSTKVDLKDNFNDIHSLPDDGSRIDGFEKLAFMELQEEVKILKENLESIRSECNKKVFDLMVEIDEEKKIRLAMQVELERLKKLIKS